MKGFIKLSLRRPYTVAIAALLVIGLGALSVTRMIVDIFPVINIPVVLVVWNYPGLSAQDMERRVVLISERAFSTTVNGIERIESQSIPGVGLLKVYFQPGTEIGAAIAQISAVSSAILHYVPPGMSPPNIIQFNASNVPVIQMTVSSKTLSEEKLFDYGLNFIRVQLFALPGLSIPGPFGGKQRQIMVWIDPNKLSAKRLAPQNVVNALLSSNVIVPAGAARLGTREYNILLNSSPDVIGRFERIPVAVRDGTPILLGDVARVADSFAVQNSIVHVNGQRATYLTILKHADASTLAVVDATRGLLPEIRAAAPQGMELNLDFDQSVFVRAAVQNVVHEAILSSVLVSLMILLFLGSWRNTVIVATAIPLSIFAALIGLLLTGNSINLMTLGGLALAIGLLVDNATVTVENIHRNQALGKKLTPAILDGAGEVVQPLTVATLAICIVFFPVVLLTGPARFLFIPLAITVVIAMLASYALSFSLVPAFSRFLLAGEDDHGEGAERRKGWGARFSARFDSAFDRVRDFYAKMLEAALVHRGFVVVIALLIGAASIALVPVIGTDFFPAADAGMLKLHYRAPPGTRIEETEQLVLKVEDAIRKIIPAAEISTVNDLVGVPIYYNLAFVQTDNISGADAEILISLKKPHPPTIDYMRAIRARLPQQFPGSEFYFQNADIVTQVLNFGLSAPIDVQVRAQKFEQAPGLAQKLLAEMRHIPGIADPHIMQVLDYPALLVRADRERGALFDVNQSGIANNLLISLSSSSLVSPSFFLNPANSVNYTVAVQAPIEKVASVSDLMALPLSPPPVPPTTARSASPAVAPGLPTMRIGDVAGITPETVPEEINHYTVQRVIDVAANVDGRDLGGVASDLQAAIARVMKGQPITTHIDVRGQNEVMQQSFRSLGLGLILAILLVYALLVVLFQSWVDPFIIMMAVPGALVGILWMLALTGTTINVESLMGTIMSVGIAVSNSILVVSFANDLRAREANMTPLQAALEAGRIRLRPVLMTAMAMIIGMVPMALAMGEAGEQNAPLGRAVIGGLVIATVSTLFIVPVFYTLLRRKPPALHTLDERFETEARGEAWRSERDPHGA